MLRDTSLLYEILLDLKEHRYINHDSDTILDENRHQKERIFDYLDDLSIELFFQYYTLNKIKIDTNICKRRFTYIGLKEVESEVELDLSNIYDRYTYLSIITDIKRWKYLFPNNKFVDNLGISEKRFSACSDSICLTCSALMFNPYVNAFKKEYGDVNLDINRVATLYLYADFHHKFSNEMKYNIPFNNLYNEIISDYALIKECEIFKGVSVEYALAIYCILCEKLNLSPIHYWSADKLQINDFSFMDGLTPILAFGIDETSDRVIPPLNLFHKFELNINKFLNSDYVDLRDCYLHFVNPEESKAFKFYYNESKEFFVDVKLFNEEPVKSALLYNPTPLPYLYSKLGL